jgi:hypothetical protein
LAPFLGLWVLSRPSTLLGLGFLLCNIKELSEMTSLEVLPEAWNVVHICNLSYSRGRGKEEHSPGLSAPVKTAKQYLKITIAKKGLGSL